MTELLIRHPLNHVPERAYILDVMCRHGHDRSVLGSLLSFRRLVHVALAQRQPGPGSSEKTVP